MVLAVRGASVEAPVLRVQVANPGRADPVGLADRVVRAALVEMVANHPMLP